MQHSGLSVGSRAPRKHVLWTSPGPVAFENGQDLIFFQKSPPKLHFTKSHIKILLLNKLWFG